MVTFSHDSEDYKRLDWTLLQNGAVTLYLRPEILKEDLDWLKGHQYRVDSFDSSAWNSEKEMHCKELLNKNRGL